MSEQDIRWIQRFNNYTKALAQLTKFMERESLNELEEQGLVKSFEYTYELAWNVLKDLLEAQGINGVIGSRGAIKEAFKHNLLGDSEKDGLIWMAMIKSRNQTSHAYDEAISKEISQAIANDYFNAFIALRDRLELMIESQNE